MAESVDALVSNTSGATRAGSTPALGTSEYFAQGLNETEVLQSNDLQHFLFSPHTTNFVDSVGYHHGLLGLGPKKLLSPNNYVSIDFQ